MKGKVFVDSNIFLYILSSDERKKNIAKKLLKGRPAITTQVISENVNVLFKKFNELNPQQIAGHARMLATYCTVGTVTFSTIELALELKEIYKYQWYDMTILSAALLDYCNILYSEDMQHNQLIEGKLTIINPFL